jgi:hypothetical protein
MTISPTETSYAFERVDEGWRAVLVNDDATRQFLGPTFPTQTEAVLYTLTIDASVYRESSPEPKGTLQKEHASRPGVCPRAATAPSPRTGGQR